MTEHVLTHNGLTVYAAISGEIFLNFWPCTLLGPDMWKINGKCNILQININTCQLSKYKCMGIIPGNEMISNRQHRLEKHRKAQIKMVLSSWTNFQTNSGDESL